MIDNEISLKDAVSFIVDNRGKSAPTETSGIKLIATNCISNTSLYPNNNNLRYVSEETYRYWFRAHPKPGDIILTNKGSQNGAVCLVPDPVDFCIAQDMVALRANQDRIDPLYLFAALRSSIVQQRIRNLNVDAVIPHFKKTDFDKLMLPLPDRATQCYIGKIYFDLVNKIELNRRMNETLEAMARAIFKDWFVDFGPTRAKAEGRAPYLASEIWDLFPDALDDEDKPRGWPMEQFGQYFELEKGLSYKGKFLEEKGIPMINLGCFLGSGRFDEEKLKGYAGDHRERHTVSPGTLVVANTDMTQKRVVLGSPHIVEQIFGNQKFLFSHHVFAARPVTSRSGFWTRYFYFHLMQPGFRERAEGFATGTTVLALPKDAVEGLEFCMPSEQVYEAFLALVEPLLRRGSANREESRALANTRDFLLPKLMSGEVRLSDAGEMVDEVA